MCAIDSQVFVTTAKICSHRNDDIRHQTCVVSYGIVISDVLFHEYGNREGYAFRQVKKKTTKYTYKSLKDVFRCLLMQNDVFIAMYAKFYFELILYLNIRVFNFL